MTPAYCGDACRARTRYALASGPGFRHDGDAGQRGAYLRSARFIRADRHRLARLGACIGCGETLPSALPSVLICETCGVPATARSATSYACGAAECRGYDAACGFQMWEPFAAECGVCAEVGDGVRRATWRRDDPGITMVCDGCRAACDGYARSIGEDAGQWAPIGPREVVPSSILPSLVEPTERRLNPVRA